MKTHFFFQILTVFVLTVFLSACFADNHARSLSPQEEAIAQTRFVLQAQTSAALYTGTPPSQPSIDLTGLPQNPSLSDLTATSQLHTGSETPPDPTQWLDGPSQTPTVPVFVTTAPAPTSTQAVTTPRANTPTTATSLSATPSKTPTHTLTPTTTLTYTATIPTGWAGEWLIRFIKSDGSLVPGILSVTVTGDDLTAQTTLEGTPYTFTGKLSSNGQIATGSWRTSAGSGSFWWSTTTAGQFSGCWNNSFGLCGARSGIGQPEPCFIPPPM